MTLDESIANLNDTIRWCKDFKEGNFTPAPTADGWSVEMHGLVSELLADLPPVLDELQNLRSERDYHLSAFDAAAETIQKASEES